MKIKMADLICNAESSTICAVLVVYTYDSADAISNKNTRTIIPKVRSFYFNS